MGTGTSTVSSDSSSSVLRAFDGFSEYPTGRFLRDARLYTVGAGTQEIRRMLIGREFNDDYKR